MLPPPFVLSTDKSQNRSLIQDVTPFLNNIIFQYTNPLPFETEPHTIHTIPLAREQCELLKSWVVVSFRCLITDIRSLNFNSEVVSFQVCLAS